MCFFVPPLSLILFSGFGSIICPNFVSQIMVLALTLLYVLIYVTDNCMNYLHINGSANVFPLRWELLLTHPFSYYYYTQCCPL